MGLPKAVEKAIKEEIERLTQLEAMIREKRKAAELLLAPDDDLVAYVSHTAPRRQPIQADPGHDGENGHSIGLRPVILGFLRAQKDQPVKARDVVLRVQQSAYRPKGTTPLRVRVNAELYRLAREGKIERVLGKRFRIKEVLQPHLTS